MIDDGLIHGPLGFSVSLSNSTGGGLSSPSSAVVTINDTDPTVSFTNTPYAVNQNAGSITITVGRAFFSSFTNSVTTVHFATSDGTAHAGVNYTAVSGTLTFGPNDQTETFSVPVIDDNMIHGPLAFNVSLSDATGGGISNPSNRRGDAQRQRSDDDLQRPDVLGPQNGGSIIVTVNRAFLASVASTVQYSTSDGTAKAGVNYLPMSGTLTFTSTVTSQSIAIPVIDDNKIHGPLTFNVTLSNPNGGGIASPSIAVVTINDTDPEISFPSPTFTFNQNAGNGTVTVTRDTTTVISTVQLLNRQRHGEGRDQLLACLRCPHLPRRRGERDVQRSADRRQQDPRPAQFQRLAIQSRERGPDLPLDRHGHAQRHRRPDRLRSGELCRHPDRDRGHRQDHPWSAPTRRSISTVDLTTVNGTAKAGINYLTVAGFLTFPVGASTESSRSRS